MKAFQFVLLVLITCVPAFSQGQSVLSYVDYIDRVKKYHPLFLSNDLQNEINEFSVRSKRGQFDPKAKVSRIQKSFDGSQYYDLLNAGLEIPTWFGGSIGGGFDQNEGSYLNPENKNPAGGLVYAYISQPILKGLIWDKRRSELRKVQAYVQLNEAKQNLLENKLVFEASKAYWDWMESHYAKDALKINFELALDRLNITKQQVLFGDKPPVDSVEATIQKDLREIAYQKAVLTEKNKKKALGQFLWIGEGVPVEVSESTIPQSLNLSFTSVQLSELTDTIPFSHPIFLQNSAKNKLITLQKRDAIENLKPKLDLLYKPLNEAAGNFSENYSTGNYTFGFNFSVPLLLRKGRNDYKISKRALQQNELALKQKQNELSVKLIQINNKITTESKLLVQYEELIRQYLIIVEAERALLTEGESSLFLLNRRESNLIKSQLKYYNSLGKWYKLKAERNNLLVLERD